MLSPNDIDRAMAALSYPVTRYWIGMVVDAAKQLETYGGTIAETRVIGYLDAIAALEVSLNTESVNAGLIQADVLKWTDRAGGKLAGLKDEKNRLVILLASTLNLRPYSNSGGCGGNTLVRS